MMQHLVGFLIALSLATVANAQPASSSSSSVVVVTVRVLSATDPAERFEIVDAAIRPGAAPRSAPQSDAAAIEAQSPEIVVLDVAGRILHRQPFTWSRVMTVPPMPPGLPNDGSPNAVVIPQPEVTIVLPGVVGAARVEVRAANALMAPVSRAIRTLPSAVSASPLAGDAPPPVTPGSLNVLLLASGFTAAPWGVWHPGDGRRIADAKFGALQVRRLAGRLSPRASDDEPRVCAGLQWH